MEVEEQIPYLGWDQLFGIKDLKYEMCLYFTIKEITAFFCAVSKISRGRVDWELYARWLRSRPLISPSIIEYLPFPWAQVVALTQVHCQCMIAWKLQDTSYWNWIGESLTPSIITEKGTVQTGIVVHPSVEEDGVYINEENHQIYRYKESTPAITLYEHFIIPFVLPKLIRQCKRMPPFRMNYEMLLYFCQVMNHPLGRFRKDYEQNYFVSALERIFAAFIEMCDSQHLFDYMCLLYYGTDNRYTPQMKMERILSHIKIKTPQSKQLALEFADEFNRLQWYHIEVLNFDPAAINRVPIEGHYRPTRYYTWEQLDPEDRYEFQVRFGLIQRSTGNPYEGDEDDEEDDGVMLNPYEGEVEEE
jgi:hypothetical protein